MIRELWIIVYKIKFEVPSSRILELGTCIKPSSHGCKVSPKSLYSSLLLKGMSKPTIKELIKFLIVITQSSYRGALVAKLEIIKIKLENTNQSKGLGL